MQVDVQCVHNATATDTVGFIQLTFQHDSRQAPMAQNSQLLALFYTDYCFISVTVWYSCGVGVRPRPWQQSQVSIKPPSFLAHTVPNGFGSPRLDSKFYPFRDCVWLRTVSFVSQSVFRTNIFATSVPLYMTYTCKDISAWSDMQRHMARRRRASRFVYPRPFHFSACTQTVQSNPTFSSASLCCNYYSSDLFSIDPLRFTFVDKTKVCVCHL